TKFFAVEGDARLAYAIGDVQLLRLALSFGGDGASSSIFDQPRRARAAVALSDELSFDAFSLFFAVRGEKIGDETFAVLPRAGIAYRASEALVLRAAFGRSLRSPTIDELYHPVEVGFSGN